MALANLPSWLNPPNFLDFMKSGADVGISQARIAQAASEAAGRLNLGYAELGSRERERGAHRDMARQSAADALKERQMEFGVRQNEAAAQRKADAGRYAEASKFKNTAQALDERKQNFLEKHSPGVRPMNVSPGSQLVDPATGKVLFNNPQSSRLNEPVVTEKFPAVEAIPGSPAYHRELFGYKIRGTETPAVPGIPGRPERSVRRAPTPQERVEMGLSAAAALAPQQPQDLPTNQGVTVRDKASGKTFRYKGNPNEVPQDKYDIVQ